MSSSPPPAALVPLLLLLLLTAVGRHSAYMVAGSSSPDSLQGEDLPTSTGRNYYAGESANVSHLLDSLLNGYDKRLRPDYKGPPVEVGITMYVSTISSISEVDMDFSLDFYFRQHWRDPRLRFDEREQELCISNDMLGKIWWPDTFFQNAKAAKFHFTTTKNAFLRIKPSGEIIQSLRLTVVAMCSMNLMYFPMDSQVCSLEIESYGYSSKDIKYTWKDGPIDSVAVNYDLQLPQFTINGYKTNERLIELSTGNYSRLACSLLFVRSLGYYVIQIYIPSCLIVVLSWVSFWLSRDAVPARVALGITTVLTMTTLISSTNASLPKISYLKSIDVYLVTCFFMVFSSLVEFAAVSYIGDQQRRPLAADKGGTSGGSGSESGTASNDVTAAGEHSGLNSLTSHTKSPSYDGHAFHTEVHLTSVGQPHARCSLQCDYRQVAQMADDVTSVADSRQSPGCRPARCMRLSEPGVIDQCARVMFPLVFVLFNLVYWFAYYNVHGHPDEEGFTGVK